ncbi:MAG: hypothetical protein ACRDCD_01860 [Mycoplasmoidaceae bacterium]
MNRQKNFIFKSLVLIIFLVSLIISFYFSIDWVLNSEFIKNTNLEIAINQDSKSTGILNIAPIDWWIGVMSVLFGSILLFLIFCLVIIILRAKDKKRLYFLGKNKEENYIDPMQKYNISFRTDTYIMDESNYRKNVSYRTEEFVPYYNGLRDDYLRNNWWMRIE